MELEVKPVSQGYFFLSNVLLIKINWQAIKIRAETPKITLVCPVPPTSQR